VTGRLDGDNQTVTTPVEAHVALSSDRGSTPLASLTLLYHKKPGQGGVTLLKGSDQKSKFLLTNREREVFELLVQDKTTRDIAQQLFISEKTVRNHISNVMQKLNVKGRSQAVVELIRLGELKI